MKDYQQSLATLRDQGFCTCGQYPWDFWDKRALSVGVSKELATLGRAVMREAYQHQWEPQLQAFCGWEDEGKAMIELANRLPEAAAFAWRKLLDTDGCRGSFHRETGEWISWI